MNLPDSPLFEPYPFACGQQVRNRMVMSPMTNWSSNQDGTISDKEIVYYKRRAKGVGMVITACAHVRAHGKGFEGGCSADSDHTIPQLRRLAVAIREQGAKAILQIFHGGRNCPRELIPDHQPLSASAVPARPGAYVPRAMTEEEILDTISGFGEATRRAIEAGFDGIEIHGANTYLVQQFFSPHSNRRTDRWGGNIRKRLTFPIAVVEEIEKVIERHAARPFILGYRLSPEESWQPGIALEDTLILIDALAQKKLDYLHISLSNFWQGSIRDKEDQRPRIMLIQQYIGQHIPLIGVGSIRTADDARKALQSGVPLVALGRELIMDPDWVQKIKENREEEIRTSLSRHDQELLAIPEPLWSRIMDKPGWFPVHAD